MKKSTMSKGRSVLFSVMAAGVSLVVSASDGKPMPRGTENPLFSGVFEPRRVLSSAPHYADRMMMKGENGEIRIYGEKLFEHENGRKESLFTVRRSFDHGLTFDEKPIADDDPGPRVKSPYSGDWITLLAISPNKRFRKQDLYAPICSRGLAAGVWLFRSSSGPDGTFERVRLPIQDKIYLMRLPLPLSKRKRWIAAGQRANARITPVVLLSDDDGHTWRTVDVPRAPAMDTPVYPHKGLRWVNPGHEPCVAELKSGRLMMLLRASMDVHYVCWSDDGGDTWTTPVPSPFYSTATMPGLYTLSDGRLVAVWNNTTPLAELDHSKDHVQPVDDSLKKGIWEDVFTNRDALHAAISDDDGKTWRGFREIYLNPIRNAADFRVKGGPWSLNDKSVHQNQLIELPDNKVLIHLGQHPSVQCVIMLDLGFLEKKERRGTFEFGLRDWTTHMYVKSRSGSNGRGHCAWNRTTGAMLLPSPEGDGNEALLIARHEDPRLYYPREGAVWNFPAARKALVTAGLRIPAGSQGLRVSLADRWMNTCDEHVAEYAEFSLVLDGDCRVNGVKLAEPDKRFTLTMEYDLDTERLFVKGPAGNVTIEKTQTLPPPFGATRQLSYLHLQTAAKSRDTTGVWLYGTNMTAR